MTLLFLGNKKNSPCTFDIQMLFLNKVYILIFFPPGFVSLAIYPERVFGVMFERVFFSWAVVCNISRN